MRSFLFPPFRNDKSEAFSVWYTFLFFTPGKIQVLWLPPMKCHVFFNDLGVIFVTWVNILSNMLILIVVMETIKTNHKNFQEVVLHWYSYMPQQHDNHHHAAVTYSCILWSCNGMGTHCFHFHSEYNYNQIINYNYILQCYSSWSLIIVASKILQSQNWPLIVDYNAYYICYLIVSEWPYSLLL